MNILIVGGTGTIGTHLVHSLSKQDYNIFLLSRNPKKYYKKFDENISLISWDTNNSDILKDIDVVVKLSGESVLQFWTKKIKKKIVSSRTNITKDLKIFFETNRINPKVVINASAVGYYAKKDAIYKGYVDEFSSNGDTFLADVCKSNEKSCDIFINDGIRVVNLRIGLVLTKEFYNLVKFLPHMGAKNNFFPWIHIDDIVGFIEFSMVNDIKGPFNLVSPTPTTHQDFNSVVIPIHFLRNIIPMTEMLLYGYKTIPKRTLESGYQFKFIDIKDAISSFRK